MTEHFASYFSFWILWFSFQASSIMSVLGVSAQCSFLALHFLFDAAEYLASKTCSCRILYTLAFVQYNTRTYKSKLNV